MRQLVQKFLENDINEILYHQLIQLIKVHIYFRQFLMIKMKQKMML